MPETIDAEVKVFRVLSEAELTRDERDEIVWRSLLSHEANEKREGAHDPEIWAMLQSSEPAEVFVMDQRTKKVFVAPNLGLVSLLAS